MNTKLKSSTKRFWAKVKRTDGCWTWTACTNNRGYGAFRDNGKTWGAHQYAWTVKRGEIPEGMCVLHRCDNPPCVRPSHLFIGTRRDNSLDMVAKGRGAPPIFSGEDNHKAKLTAPDVLEIRRRYKRGKGAEIGREFGVSQPLISNIILRQVWKHI